MCNIAPLKELVLGLFWLKSARKDRGSVLLAKRDSMCFTHVILLLSAVPATFSIDLAWQPLCNHALWKSCLVFEFVFGGCPVKVAFTGQGLLVAGNRTANNEPRKAQRPPLWLEKNCLSQRTLGTQRNELLRFLD